MFACQTDNGFVSLRDFTIMAAIVALVHRIGHDFDLCLHLAEENFDNPFPEMIDYWQDTTVVGFFDDELHNSRDQFGLQPSDLAGCKTLADVYGVITEHFDVAGAILINVTTPEEKAKQELTSRRQRLEQSAVMKSIIARAKADGGTGQFDLDFLNACAAEVDRYQSYREGMREDGPCMGYGVTHEQWSDEFVASQGDTATVHEIMDWVAEACPLLFMQWREQRQQHDS